MKTSQAMCVKYNKQVRSCNNFCCGKAIIMTYYFTIFSTKTKSMAMQGKHIQGVKIVINDNITEQVTDFKYLEYRISEFKSDLEDKLQTYNKIN